MRPLTGARLVADGREGVVFALDRGYQSPRPDLT